MGILDRIKLLIDFETFDSFFQWLLTNIFSAILGCLFGFWITKSKTVIIGIILIFVFSAALVIIQSFIGSSFNIEKSLKANAKMGYWKEIIRTAYPISNSLWYSGKYKLRVSIANYIDIACVNLLSQNITAIKLNLDDIPINYIRSSILIDDMGWTLFRLNNRFYTKARENIFRGINIAENEKYYDLLLKGYKHLFCITVELDKCFDNTQAYFDKINSILSREEYLQLSDNERSSIEAGLYYSLSASYLTIVKQIENESEQKKYFLYQAREYIEKSIRYYKKYDIERYIKTFSVKAEILFLLEPLKYMPLIDELINEGLVLSQLHQERDRYFRLIILKMQVLLQKVQDSLNKYELEMLNHELSTIQHEVQKSIKVSPLYYRQYKKLYKQIKVAMKNKVFKFSYH